MIQVQHIIIIERPYPQLFRLQKAESISRNPSPKYKLSESTKYTSKLADRRILVISGSSGIGFTVAEACNEHKAHIAISSSNPPRVESAVEKIKTSYPNKAANIRGLMVDLGNPATLESELEKGLKESVQERGGMNLDHVIFTAGDELAPIPLQDIKL